MPFSQERLDQFFATYERSSLSHDPGAAAAQYAESFLAAVPQGPQIVPAVLFAEKLPMRKRLFDKAGLKSTELIARRDLFLGERYVLVGTEWRMNFAPENQASTSLEVSSSFLVDLGGDPEPKIIAYIAHDDVFDIMKERKLLPPG